MLPGLFVERPKSFSELVEQEERFSVFLPLGAALSRGTFRIVASESVPKDKESFPIFRSRTRASAAACKLRG